MSEHNYGMTHCPTCQRNVPAAGISSPPLACSAAVDLLRDLAQCYEEDTGIKLDGCDQDTTQYAVWEFLTRQPQNTTHQARAGSPSPECAGWRRCEWAEGEQHRCRLLTGSIGLEGRWSEWIDGKPEKSLMQFEYEYRRRDHGA